jgi:3-amino-5-hydroxybenzoate synthase
MDKRENVFPKWPVWDEEELAVVESVVRSDKWWCGSPGERVGENVWEFQREFARFQKAEHCIAVANGTVAIETVLAAFDIGMGDEVIVSDYTFVASASAVVATNAVPIFCDIDPATYLMDVDKIEHLITSRTRAIIAVHLGGNPVEMDRLSEIAKNHGLKIVEDCAHAHGSRFKGKRVGTWGEAGTFSFQASKILTAGEGGAVVCDDSALAEKVYSLSDCGRKPGEYFYSHYSYGSNSRMPEFLAALLRVQLKKFPSQHRKRNENARYLTQKLNSIEGISVMKQTQGTDEMGYYIYPFVFDPRTFGNMTKEAFIEKLHEAGIPTDDCYPPLHTLTCFKDVKLRKGIDYSRANWGGQKSKNVHFPVVTDIYSRSVQFPQNVLLAERKQLDYIADVVRNLQ